MKESIGKTLFEYFVKLDSHLLSDDTDEELRDICYGKASYVYEHWGQHYYRIGNHPDDPIKDSPLSFLSRGMFEVFDYYRNKLGKEVGISWLLAYDYDLNQFYWEEQVWKFLINKANFKYRREQKQKESLCTN